MKDEKTVRKTASKSVGSPPKRGSAAKTFLHIRVDEDRKAHYAQCAAKRHSEDKSLSGLVIDTMDRATGYRDERD